MKVSILTFSKESNNGAVLQCYALTEAIRQLGHEVNIIDIQLPVSKKLPIKTKVLFSISKFFYRPFISKLSRYYTRKYNTPIELRNNPPKSDAFIVGSDQVWNFDITKRLDPYLYFFDFVPHNAKKISYAASIGSNTWKWAEEKSKVRGLLEQFDSISVREDSAKSILNSEFEIQSDIVCDPTFLLSSYDSICGIYDESKETNDLVYFKFFRTKEIDKAVLEFSNKHSLRAHCLLSPRFAPGYKRSMFSTVKNWLNTIRYSKFVVTDSYHGLAFCIIFNKQFISMPSQPDRADRHLTLLRTFGLEHRFCFTSEELNNRFEELYNNHIDYSKIEPIKQQIRKAGLGFLNNALK